MVNRSGTEEAVIAVQRALLNCVGPAAAEQLAQAQARLAWLEVTAEIGPGAPGMSSRLVRVRNGVGEVEATHPLLAQELILRATPLLEAVNSRQRGRPGAVLELRQLHVSVRLGER